MIPPPAVAGCLPAFPTPTFPFAIWFPLVNDQPVCLRDHGEREARATPATATAGGMFLSPLVLRQKGTRVTQANEAVILLFTEEQSTQRRRKVQAAVKEEEDSV